MTAAQLVRMAGGFMRDALLTPADLISYSIVNGTRVRGERSTIAIGNAVRNVASSGEELRDEEGNDRGLAETAQEGKTKQCGVQLPMPGLPLEDEVLREEEAQTAEPSDLVGPKQFFVAETQVRLRRHQTCKCRDETGRLQTRMMLGVGAAFDYHSGRIQDSPEWVKLAGLQWFHRLLQDPRRLWKRYLYSNSAFLWHLALQATGLRRLAVPPPIEEDLAAKHAIHLVERPRT